MAALNMISNLYCNFTKTIFFLDEYWLDCEDPENERRPEVNYWGTLIWIENTKYNHQMCAFHTSIFIILYIHFHSSILIIFPEKCLLCDTNVSWRLSSTLQVHLIKEKNTLFQMRVAFENFFVMHVSLYKNHYFV